jgi:hypothetical protein
MLRVIGRVSLAPSSLPSIGRRFAGGGPRKVQQMTLEQAELASTQLQQNMANVVDKIAEMKAQLPANVDELEKTAPVIVQATYDISSGVARISPQYLQTPWDSMGLDGGSAASLILRAERQTREMESELQALDARITELNKA